MFCVFGGGKFNYDGNLREPIPRNLICRPIEFFAKKLSLRNRRAQKGAHGRHSERTEAITKVLEVILAEDLAGAELAFLSIALGPTPATYRRPGTPPAFLATAPPRVRFAGRQPRPAPSAQPEASAPLLHPDEPHDCFHSRRTRLRMAAAAESAKSGHRIFGLVDALLSRPKSARDGKAASPPP